MIKLYIIYNLLLTGLCWIFILPNIRKYKPYIKEAWSNKNTRPIIYGFILGIIIYIIDLIWSIIILIK